MTSKTTLLKGPTDKLFLKIIKPIRDSIDTANDQNKLIDEQLDALTGMLSFRLEMYFIRCLLSFSLSSLSSLS